MNTRTASLLGLALAVAGGVRAEGPLGRSFVPPKMSSFRSRTAGGVGLLSLPPKLVARLRLSPSQKARLAEIKKSLRDGRRGLFAPGAGSGDRRADLLTLAQNQRTAEADALAVLNPAQRKQVDAWNRQAKRYDGLGPRVNTALLCVTGLSSAQQARLAQLSEKVKQVRASTLQRIADRPRPVIGFGTMVSLERDAVADTKRLLTPPQRQEFQTALNSLSGGIPG